MVKRVELLMADGGGGASGLVKGDGRGERTLKGGDVGGVGIGKRARGLLSEEHRGDGDGMRTWRCCSRIAGAGIGRLFQSHV